MDGYADVILPYLIVLWKKNHWIRCIIMKTCIMLDKINLLSVLIISLFKARIIWFKISVISYLSCNIKWHNWNSRDNWMSIILCMFLESIILEITREQFAYQCRSAYIWRFIQYTCACVSTINSKGVLLYRVMGQGIENGPEFQ